MNPILGVDTSKYQGEQGVPIPNLRKLHANGIRFLIGRASIGEAADGALVTTHKRAEALGWTTGGYHFGRRGRGNKQAEIFVDRLDATPGGTTGTIAALDVEWWTQSSRTVPELCIRPGDVEDFVGRFRELLPTKPLGGYTSEGYYGSPYMKNPDHASLFDFLWQARWIDGDPVEAITLPPGPPLAGFGGWRSTPLWQWGRIILPNGKPFDGDAFYGSLADLKALAERRLPPIQDRPRYKAGAAAYVSALKSQATAITIPDPGSGPAWEAGVSYAREAALNALDRATLK